MISSFREALEQVRAALPDSSFAKQEGIDPDLIHRINAALGSTDFNYAQLKQLLVESRTALPTAWQNHGGCSDDLLNLIDCVIAQ
ncbi:hypothetical protein [Methylosarcina fibrata]|uniref:hypothetical protein n=1 Tax=Methylosarcina fibrata TaxID=105972 RepID=UPI00039A7352|nr:hypothetical protein [Methylosarcina fibrata]